MATGTPARTLYGRPRMRKVRVLAVLVAIAAMAVALRGQLSSSPPSSPRGAEAPAPTAGGSPGVPRDLPRRALGEADGSIPDGVTVFDQEVPGVGRLDPDLLAALRLAATEAVDDGVVLYVDSGWRSPAYQEHLLQQAISKYGSEAEAARWVATPATSAHVSGDAVDIGHADAAAWLSAHGARYGLCQIYRNEPWHYELRPDAPTQGCPPMYADPTQDPRMAG